MEDGLWGPAFGCTSTLCHRYTFHVLRVQISVLTLAQKFDYIITTGIVQDKLDLDITEVSVAAVHSTEPRFNTSCDVESSTSSFSEEATLTEERDINLDVKLPFVVKPLVLGACFVLLYCITR